MKRTAWALEKSDRPDALNGLWAERKITCEVTGEMDTGTKVWTELATGEQWFLMRMMGVYFFYKE